MSSKILAKESISEDPVSEVTGTKTPDGKFSLDTSPSQFTDEALLGRKNGVSFFTKFGHNLDLTAASGEQTLWTSTGNFAVMATAETFTIGYNNSTDGLGTAGALELTFNYIDSAGLRATTAHTLGNTGTDVTSFTGLGINRVKVTDTGGTTFNTNDITIDSTTGGTPQADIPASGAITQQAIYHTGSDSDAILRYLWINVNKISGGGSPRVTILGYIFNRITSTRSEIFRTTIDTGVENTVHIYEPVGFKLEASEVLYFVADTDTNNTIAAVRFSLIEYARSE